MSGEPLISLLPGPPRLVDSDDRSPRDPGAWGYYTEADRYRRALWSYRTAFAFCILVELVIPLAMMIQFAREEAKRPSRRRSR